MATISIILIYILSVTWAYTPQTQWGLKDKIFAEEKLEGAVFHNIDNEVVPIVGVNSYRLPTTTKPIHYDIFIWTDFNSNNPIGSRMFQGTANIHLKATQANVREIVIHADNLDITSLTLRYNGANIPVKSKEDNPENHHFLRIELDSGVLEYSATQDLVYVLTISYQAAMRTDMTGLYESWFKSQTNDIKYMASTHFQATAARRAFPCYDEPNLKATFKFTIRRPITYKSWTGTKLAETKDFDALFEDDVFSETPVMPTYLICIVVADYETTHKSGILKYEVIARKEAISNGQAEYALEVGKSILEAMSNYTDYDFYTMNPNLKMTQAAIPDFSAGAMENWGLLVYREAYLMYDPQHTDSLFKQRIAYILSHEIAHMWFGNLVTCDWWDMFWLNEGFARFYQYYLTHWVVPEMRFDTRFINEQVHTALLADSANNPHPLTNHGMGSPVAIRTMFSSISYNKGACVIRMTEHLLGFEVHRLGLQSYLQNRKFRTALPEHLFEALEAEANRTNAISEYGPDFSLTEYYKSFTEQAGHPVLIVNVNHQTGNMMILQRRFNINTGFSSTNERWVVPITFASASNPDFSNTKPTHIIKESLTNINRGSTGDEWVIFNKQQSGFYRVLYDDYTWHLITIALRGEDREKIHEYNKAQIVNDVFQFARSELMPYAKALNILSFLEFETAYAPWAAAITDLNWIRNRVAGHAIQPKLEALIGTWAERVMTDIGYDETGTEPFLISYLRYQLAPVMCQLNFPGCRNTAIRLFNELKNNNVEVPVDSRIWVYCNALREGNQNDFDFLWTRFLNHNVYTEKILLLQTLGCTTQRNALYTIIESIVVDNHIIRRQDYITAYNAAVNSNEENKWIVLDYIESNMEKVKTGFGNLATPLGTISSRLRSQAEVTRFRNWVDANRGNFGTEYTTIYNGAQNSLNNIQWTNDHKEDFEVYFNNGYYPVTTSTTAAPKPDQFVPETKPDIKEPETPELPSSASNLFISGFAITIALIIPRFM